MTGTLLYICVAKVFGHSIYDSTDEELEVGMSMVDTLHSARDFQLQKEIKEEEKRQAREEHEKWVKEGWKHEPPT